MTADTRKILAMLHERVDKSEPISFAEAVALFPEAVETFFRGRGLDFFVDVTTGEFILKEPQTNSPNCLIWTGDDWRETWRRWEHDPCPRPKHGGVD